MMEQSLSRVVHSSVCIAAFVGWYLCAILVWAFPGFSALYPSELAAVFMHMAVLLPFSLLAWKLYAAHYPFLSLGRFSLRELWLPLLASGALALIYQQFAQPEPWMDSLSSQPIQVKWMLFITACLCAPVSEEIIFRGFVLNSSIGWGRSAKTAGIIITSLLFSAIHIQYQTMASFVYLFIFSAILCVVRINTRGLLLPIILHAVFNIWSMLTLLDL